MDLKLFFSLRAGAGVLNASVSYARDLQHVYGILPVLMLRLCVYVTKIMNT